MPIPAPVLLHRVTLLKANDRLNNSIILLLAELPVAAGLQ